VTGAGQVRFENIRKTHGPVVALKGIDLEIEPGEFFALLGPSGSGKSTTLRILAGLDMPTAGRVVVDGRDITSLPPSDRDVAMVFQSYALYPHMTVHGNIAFPLEMAKLPKDEIEPAVREAARKVKIDHLLDRKPGQLSGGQQQRCALARAIVRKAKLFLLDEPLSNLDAKLRLETRIELKKLQRSLGVTAVYVTHDQEEAMTLADRLAVFMEGEVRQVGRPSEVFARPNSVAVAGFIGSPPMNLLSGRYNEGQVILANYRLRTTLQEGGSRDVTVGIRPGAMRIGSGRHAGEGGTRRGSRRHRNPRSRPRRDADPGSGDERRRAPEGDTIQLTARPRISTSSMPAPARGFENPLEAEASDSTQGRCSRRPRRGSAPAQPRAGGDPPPGPERRAR
jgi:ABC-type sugar transport system ATPase subunit